MLGRVRPSFFLGRYRRDGSDGLAKPDHFLRKQVAVASRDLDTQLVGRSEIPRSQRSLGQIQFCVTADSGVWSLVLSLPSPTVSVALPVSGSVPAACLEGPGHRLPRT